MNSAGICIDVHCIWYGQHTAAVCCTGSTANRAAMKPTEPPLAHAALIRADPRAPTDDTLAGRVVVFSVDGDCILRMVGITRLSVTARRRHRGGSSRGGNNIKTVKWRLDLASVFGCNCGCTRSIRFPYSVLPSFLHSFFPSFIRSFPLSDII